MENAYNILITLLELDGISYIDMIVGRLKFVRASKFWKLLAQLASWDFRQSFTPVAG